MDTVHVLIEQKRNTPKLGMAPSISVINKFIEEMLFEKSFEMPRDIIYQNLLICLIKCLSMFFEHIKLICSFRKLIKRYHK